jgi:hypothetical protein
MKKAIGILLIVSLIMTMTAISVGASGVQVQSQTNTNIVTTNQLINQNHWGAENSAAVGVVLGSGTIASGNSREALNNNNVVIRNRLSQRVVTNQAGLITFN